MVLMESKNSFSYSNFCAMLSIEALGVFCPRVVQCFFEFAVVVALLLCGGSAPNISANKKPDFLY